LVTDSQIDGFNVGMIETQVNGGFDAIGDFTVDNQFKEEMSKLNLSLKIKV
jgi:hypothetical protein